MYLRKHWFKIATEQGPQMTLCFERQARSKRTEQDEMVALHDRQRETAWLTTRPYPADCIVARSESSATLNA